MNRNKTIRWALFLPAAIVSSMLVNIFWELINLVTLSKTMSPESFSFNLYNQTTAGMIAGFALLYAGSYVAPYKGVKTFLLCFSIFTAMVGILTNIYLSEENNSWKYLFFCSYVFGSFMALRYLNKKSAENVLLLSFTLNGTFIFKR